MEVDALYEYNAPQFVDFELPLMEDSNVEEYFDFDHENGIPVVQETPTQATPRRSSRSNTTLTASALKDSNNLTPRRSNRIKMGNTPKGDSGFATAEKENITSEGVGAKNAVNDSCAGDNAAVVSANICTSSNSGQGLQKQGAMKAKPNKPCDSPLAAATLKDSNNLTPRRSNRITTGNTPKGDSGFASAQKENASEGSAGVKETVSESTASDHVTRVPANICTSLEEWNRKKGASSKADQGAQRKGPMKAKATSSAPEKLSNSKPSFRTPVLDMRRIRKSSVGSEKVTPDPPAAKKLKRSSSTASLLSKPRQGSVERPIRATAGPQRVRSTSSNPPPHARSLSASRHSRTHSGAHARTQSVESSRTTANREKAEREKGETESAQTRKPKLTIPVTPSVLKRDMSAPVDKKTAEERELEEIRRLRKELAQKRKKAEESHKLAQSSSSYQPTRATQAPTKAEGFQFATDQRLKNQPSDTRKEKDEDFVAGLRHHSTSSSPAKCAPKRTIPAPFHFHEEKKRKRAEEEEATAVDRKYKSVAEQVNAFIRTPDRFRSRPANKERSPVAKKTRESKLTVPKTPNFETRTRTRNAHIVSQADIEAKELEDIKKYKFKAHGMNEQIFKRPSGVRKVASKEPTQFAEFDLETNRRVKANTSDGDEHYTFQANPIPKKILQGTVGVKAPEPIPLTKPASPAFALKNRIRNIRQQVEETCQSMSLGPRSKPVPHLGIPFQPKLEHKVTESQPFSFETRDKQTLRNKEEKKQKLYEDERKLREFHANPLPSDSPDALPSKKAKRPTVAEPFQLEVDERGAHRVEELQTKVEEETKIQRQQTVFKARPAKSIYQQPFIPKKSMKTLTDDSMAFELSTEHRHERWAELDKYKHDRDVEMDIQQREMERRRQDEEKAQLRRLRQDTVHHAKGIRHFKPVEVQPSSMPLTQPSTPRFSERLKSRSGKP